MPSRECSGAARAWQLRRAHVSLSGAQLQPTAPSRSLLLACLSPPATMQDHLADPTGVNIVMNFGGWCAGGGKCISRSAAGTCQAGRLPRAWWFRIRGNWEVVCIPGRPLSKIPDFCCTMCMAGTLLGRCLLHMLAVTRAAELLGWGWAQGVLHFCPAPLLPS